MVKNVNGGNKAKGFAHKNFIKRESALRASMDEDEVYAQVTKMLGGSICQVVLLDGTNLLCHIRGKFRGRKKRDNLIRSGSWLLVGKREWESSDKPMNCDVIEVYDDSDKIKLKNNITNVDWSVFISNDIKMIDNNDLKEDEFGITFVDEKTHEFQTLIETQAATTSSKPTTFIAFEEDEINIDDI